MNEEFLKKLKTKLIKISIKDFCITKFYYVNKESNWENSESHDDFIVMGKFKDKINALLIDHKFDGDVYSIKVFYKNNIFYFKATQYAFDCNFISIKELCKAD